MADFTDGRIDELINSGIEFRGADYIKKGWDIFKSAPGMFLGYLVVMWLITFVLGMIPLVNIIANFLSPIFAAGFYIVARKIDTGQNFDFGNFFDGFKRNPGQIVLATLIMALVIVACMIPAIFGLIPAIRHGGGPGILGIVGGLVSFGLVFYFAIHWIWSIQLIIFHNLQAWPALQSSMKLVKGRLGPIVVFGLMLIGINILGLLALIVGVTVTACISQIAMYAAYSDITKLNEQEGMDIMDHLVDEERV